jgi:hypothetical protein
VVAQDISHQSTKNATHAHERIPRVREYELWAYIEQRNHWTDGIYDSISWTAYRSAISIPTHNGRTFEIKQSHDWLPVGVWERRCGATTDSVHSAPRPVPHSPEAVPHLYLYHSRTTWCNQFITQFTKLLIGTSTAADLCCIISIVADLRCIIALGIPKWFLTGVRNEPET